MMVEVETNKVKTIAGFYGQLRKMLESLEKAQAKHREINAKMVKKCLEEDKFRKKEIADAKTALAAALEHRAKAQASKNAAEKALPGLVRTRNAYQKELSRAIKQRNEERKKYLQRRADFQEAIAFLRDFIQFINKKLKGHFKAFDFVQFSEKLLQHSSRIGVAEAAVPALVAIAEFTYSDEPKHNDYEYKANEALGAKLKRVLNELLARLVADNQKNEEDERKAVIAFNLYKKRLEAAIATLNKNIKRTEQQIRDMTKSIAVETKIITQSGKKLQRNDGLRIAAQKLCAACNKEFIEATKARLDEIATMQAILKIAARRLKEMPKDLVDFLESVKNGFKAYVNSTEFKGFVAYKRKTYIANQRGRNLIAKNNLLK